MRRTLSIFTGAAGLVLLLAGCGKGTDDAGLTPPPPPPAPAAAEVGASAAPAASAPAPVAPPDAGLAATPTSSAPAEVKETDLFGGNGRPLTEEEKMLLNYGIDMFKEEKGRFPANIQEAVASRHITRLPKLPEGEQLNYDPTTGRVTVVKK